MKMFNWLFGFLRKSAKPAIENPYPNAKRCGVFVGLTHVDPSAYGGWDGKCPGCDVDVVRFHKLASQHGVEGVVLRDSAATKRAWVDAVKAAAAGLGAGDLLVLYYSGHGGQMKDLSGDEADGLDETLCFWDGQLADDVLASIFDQLPTGLRIFMVTDCCNSKTLARGAVPVVGEHILRLSSRFRHLQMIHYAGSDDGKSSFGWIDGGEFTNALRATVKLATYESWFISAAPRMPAYQQPYCTEYNASDVFRSAPVFG
ncbi:MAG: caspase family protein [Pontiellaceae bacterium]|nr:caspase family protein [Pontiellaceae bacterium]MBN2785149.1 caspase family protein [Pontiellaceae bacterium]